MSISGTFWPPRDPILDPPLRIRTPPDPKKGHFLKIYEKKPLPGQIPPLNKFFHNGRIDHDTIFFETQTKTPLPAASISGT